MPSRSASVLITWVAIDRAREEAHRIRTISSCHPRDPSMVALRQLKLHNAGMTTRDPLEDDLDIHPEAAVAPGYLANHASRLFNRNIDTRLRGHGMSLALLAPILQLSWKGPMRQRDLVEGAAVNQPAMVALLGKLEGMGLVTREPVTGDRRAAIVTLTQEGSRLAEIGGDALRQENARGIAGLSTEEGTMLVSLLRRFIAGLEAGT